MTWSVACIIVASQREAGAHTDRRADDTDHLEARDWAVRVQGYPSCTRARRARGARSESPQARAPRNPRDALFPRGTTSAARDTRRLRLRGSRASARTPGIAPDLRPTERAPQTQDRAHARAPGDRPARRTQPRGCVVAPRAPPQRTLFYPGRAAHIPVDEDSLPRPSSAARAASSHAEPSRYRHRPLPPQVSARLFARENLDPRVAPSFAPRTQVRPLPSPSA